MNDCIRLGNEVSRNTASLNPNDVSLVKQLLTLFGCYQPPEWGITDDSDDETFTAIKRYQKKSNLKTDGVMKPQGETETAINNELKRHRPAYAEFNGREYTVIEDGNEVLRVPAMSGKPGAQCRSEQDAPSIGPIPEGKWILRRGGMQDRQPGDDDAWQRFKNNHSAGNEWRSNPTSWGNHRIKLEPAEDTQTYGRDKMYLHGGKIPGSEGCIDLTENMDKFADYFKNYDDDLILNVKYDEECW